MFEEVLAPLIQSHRATQDQEIYAVIEDPPPNVTSKVKRGSQARIGVQLGRVMGLVETVLAELNVNATLVEVIPWRRGLTAMRQSLGLRDVAPTRRSLERAKGLHLGFRREGRKLYVRYRKCGHEVVVPSLEQLSPSCSQCLRGIAHEQDVVRDVWKRHAVEWAQLAYPAAIRDVIDEARLTARDKEQPVHKLQGVSDACEALAMAEVQRRTMNAVAT